MSNPPQNSTPPSQPTSIPKLKVRERKRDDPSFLELEDATLDANRHYRWVRCRSDEYATSVAKHKRRGYQLETIREGGPKTVAEPDKRPDKVIAMGDLVLMSCPVEAHETRIRQRRAHTEQLLASTSATTKEMARQKGVKVIDDDEDS